MTGREDFDQQLRDWSDLGDDRLPSRYLEAALGRIEMTPQRGARWWPLEGFLMKLKPATPILGIAAVVLLALAAYQFFGPSGVGDADPTPRAYTTEDLPTILITGAELPDGATIGGTRYGRPVLTEALPPSGDDIDASAVVDGLATDVEFQGEGIYTTWSVLFETSADAEQAFDVIVAEHESEQGWDVGASRTDPNLGDESAAWTGELYDLAGESSSIIWRTNNLLLAAVGWGDADVSRLRSIADGMAARAD
jgi:hypothetical protein